MKTFGLSPALVRSASFIAIATGLALPQAAFAQTDTAAPAAQDTTTAQQGTPAADASDQSNDIVVTGIRASLERSIAIKRNSFGVVDAISAEDIGKFPSTNLAESLQRITGVSIDRVNGEGAQVTVRGFGPDYNLVTLNGRTLASTYDQTVGGDETADGIHPIGRSFDFSNLASEGVKTLEVYKTGRAAVPSGGIGATINVVTRRPLDGRAGLSGTIEAKGDYDTSWRDCDDCGGPITPDLTGMASWANPSKTFGVSLFGSYSERHFSTVSATSNGWNIVPYSTFLNGGYVRTKQVKDTSGALVTVPSICSGTGTTPVAGCTVVNNAPSNSNQLVGVPNDSRYHFGDDEYKRFNVQGVIEFKPTDSLTLTADALYANNIEREQRSDTSNWFTRPFDVVTFDGNPTIDTTTYLHETLNGPKDEDYEQQYRAQKNKLQDYGLNLQWNVTNNFTFTLDGHYGKSSVTPDLPNGTTSTLVGLGANVVDAHDVDYSGDIPVEHITFDDSRSPAADGVLDVGDIGSSVGRTFTNSVYQRVKEIRGDFGWDVGGGNRIDFGALYRSVRTEQDSASTQQILGNWSVDHPGDVERVAPGIIHEFCLMCRFHDFNPQATGVDAISFRGNAIDLYNALSSYYGGSLNPFSGVNTDKEDVYAAYVQSTWKFHLGGMDAGLVAGVRYEHTRERAETFQVVPNAIVWNADNDFTVTNGTDPVAVYGKGGYHNFLPSIDFQLHMTNNLIGRLSYSRTMARPNYNLLFPSTTVTGGPGRPTVLGGFPTGQEGNTALLPLVSDNIDASLEWYFKRDSYVSVGAFYKRVKDFIGTGQTTGPLFGLRDPTSAAAGTRSGVAKNALTGIGADITDVNLFTMTALLQKYNGNVASATADYTAPGHSDPVTRAVNYDYGNTILSQYDILGDSTDPLYQFAISRPINSKDADLYGVEVAGQYFLGNTGFGVSGSFTYVDGNVSFDNGAPTNIDQFALTGLSNTANATLIYDKNGLSARVAWNWRDKFLSATNRDAFHNPVYTRPYSTIDFDFSYDITPHWGIDIQGLNLTNESLRTYGRSENELWFAQELQRRFMFGARYKF